MAMLSICIIIDIAVVLPVNYAKFQWRKIRTKFANKTNDIKRYRVISPHVKFHPWRRDGYGCITTLTSLWIKVEMIRQITNKHVYVLFANISKVCFLYNRCIACGLNNPNHSGDETKRFPFLNIPVMHFGLFFRLPKEKLFLFTLNISNFERRLILLV
mgnify:CR=1 FL=1